MKKIKLKTPKQNAAKLKQLEEKRIDNVQFLITWTFEELKQLKADLHQRINMAKDEGLADIVKYVEEKWMQVHEAIAVKKGNEKQAWDYLT